MFTFYGAIIAGPAVWPVYPFATFQFTGMQVTKRHMDVSNGSQKDTRVAPLVVKRRGI